MGPFSWVLGAIGIAILAASLFQVQRDWFDVARSQKPRLSKQARHLYLVGIVLGFGMFIVAMIVGPHR